MPILCQHQRILRRTISINENRVEETSPLIWTKYTIAIQSLVTEQTRTIQSP